MKNILVPIGTSPDSHKTLQYAVDFAADFDAGIFVMEVFSAPSVSGSFTNIEEKISENSREHLKEVISRVNPGKVPIQIATYKGDIITGLKEIDNELGIDLIIIAPRSNDIQEELYLGNTSGRIIKRTDIPTLIVPREHNYKPFSNILTAFSSGILKKKSILDPLKMIRDKCNAELNLLMVKTPGYKQDDLKVNTALLDLSSQLNLTEHATTYLGVLEHLQSFHPDLLCVFRRKRGFFTTLWEKNTIPKSEFSAKVPVLVLSTKKD